MLRILITEFGHNKGNVLRRFFQDVKIEDDHFLFPISIKKALVKVFGEKSSFYYFLFLWHLRNVFL